MGSASNSLPGRVFAVVPAAGHSRRMGRHKLLLTVQGQTVIRRLVEVLMSAGVDNLFVLVREDDRALRAELATTAARVRTVPESTPDMRASVALLLAAIESEINPTERDAWLLSPADHPVLKVAVVRSLLQAWSAGCGPILVPTCEGRRGHPTLFAWQFASQVGSIPANHGLDWLLRQQAAAVVELPMDEPDVLLDLDTPADYERLRRRTDLSPDSDTPRVCDAGNGSLPCSGVSGRPGESECL